MRRLMGFTLGLCCAVIVAMPVLGQAYPDEGKDGQDEMAAMMATMLKYAAPGEHHAHLKSMAGKWTLSSRFRMTEDAAWDTSGGESTISWILGGRFLQQTVNSPPSEAMPMPFEGFGLLGYDNFAKKHIGIWMDSFFTGVMVMKGSCDESGKVITLSGEIENPMKGGEKTKERWVYRIINDDKFIVEIWQPDDAGKMYMHGEITYNRVK